MNEHEKWDLLLDELIPKGTAGPPETVMLSLKELRPFHGHPYKVEDNEEMEALTESVRGQGILTPLLVRRTVNSYEVISGHRRLRAAERAGLTEIPVRIVEMDRDAAAVALSMAYEEEQRKLKAEIPGMQSWLETEMDRTEDLQRFISKVKQLTEIRELTPELIHQFIDRIVVYAPKYLDGKRHQVVDIFYSGVGILNELSPKEMEEAFQKSLAEQARGKEKPA